MVSKELDIFAFVVTCTALSLSLVLNTIGIYFLKSLKKTLTNQKILLINLSLAELLSASTILIWRAMDYMQFLDIAERKYGDFYIFLRGLKWYCYYVYLLAPLIITLDRLVGITCPLKYENILSKEKATVAVILNWIIALLLIIPFIFIDSKLWLIYAASAASAIGLIVTIVAVSTYAVIGIIVRKQKLKFETTRKETRVFRVALYIVLTFFLLVVVSDIVMITLAGIDRKLAKEYMQFIYCFGNINYAIDPILYIWGYRPLRERVRKTSKERDLSKYILSVLQPTFKTSESQRKTTVTGKSIVTFSNEAYDNKV